jgi:hypothetical protein
LSIAGQTVLYRGAALLLARDALSVRAVLMVRLLMVRLLMVRLLMVRLLMVPHRGVPVIAVHVRERHRRRSERSYDEDSKSLLENLFHENPGGQYAGIRREARCNESNHCYAPTS